MKAISLQKLKELDYNPKGLSNYKLVECICIRCNSNFEYSSVKKFLGTRKNKILSKKDWDTCQKCWLRINTCENPDWIKKNSISQFIAQNKPEQKKKNSEGVKKSYTTEKREKYSLYLKNRWVNDICFAEKARQNISWTEKNDDRYQEIMKKSLGTGGLRGEYNNIRYDSLLELSYILYCIDNQISISRYNLEAINYFDENNIIRKYIPDFIINNNTIVEIKGFGLYYNKNIERNKIKIEYAKQWCVNNNLNYTLLFNTDKILKKNYKKAKKLHYENKTKNNNTL